MMAELGRSESLSERYQLPERLAEYLRPNCACDCDKVIDFEGPAPLTGAQISFVNRRPKQVVIHWEGLTVTYDQGQRCRWIFCELGGETYGIQATRDPNEVGVRYNPSGLAATILVRAALFVVDYPTPAAVLNVLAAGLSGPMPDYESILAWGGRLGRGPTEIVYDYTGGERDHLTTVKHGGVVYTIHGAEGSPASCVGVPLNAAATEVKLVWLAGKVEPRATCAQLLAAIAEAKARIAPPAPFSGGAGRLFKL